MRRILIVSFLGFAVMCLAGCPKGNQDYKAARKAEIIGDYDTAVVEYDKALKTDPLNAEYKLRALQARSEAAEFHIAQGRKDLNAGQLELALSEFEKAHGIDPGNEMASQESEKTMQLLANLKHEEQPKPINVEKPEDTGLLSAPPQLKPLSLEPIGLSMTNDCHLVYQAIGKIAGISVIFDPDFQGKRVTVQLPNVTLEQALDAVSYECGAFWKPVTSNIILVATNSVQKRHELEDEEVQTFYLRNNMTPADITELVNGLRQVLDLRRILQVNADNAIVIRATPDELIAASKIIDSVDKAKPEVMLKVDVLEARMDRERDLGIQPGQSATLAFTPRSSIQPSSSSSSSSSSTTNTTPQITLNNLHHLSSADYSLTLPGATLNALLTDSTTRIIQDPTIRVTDGTTAKLAIGDRVPIAVSTLTPGVGVATGGVSGINTLGSTSFQYEPVGVNLEVTPRVHPDGDVSMNITVEVSSVTGQSNIGGIQQPTFSQRKIGPDDVRLADGETYILGGLITRNELKSLSGWPGLARIPFLRYLFSSENTQTEDDEVLIAVTPHIVRMLHITPDDLRTLAAGTDQNVQVYPKSDGALPGVSAPPAGGSGAPTPNSAAAGERAPAGTSLQFEPAAISMKPGQTMTIGLNVANARDLFSVPLLLQYDPKVIEIDDIRDGGFLSGGTQEIAIVQQIDAQQGQAVISATRRPNTPGISGSGTLVGIVIKALAPGTCQLRIAQVNARDSQQKAIGVSSGTATIQVQ